MHDKRAGGLPAFSTDREGIPWMGRDVDRDGVLMVGVRLVRGVSGEAVAGVMIEI